MKNTVIWFKDIQFKTGAKVYNLGNSIMARNTYIIADLDKLSLILKTLARGSKYSRREISTFKITCFKA